MVNAATKRRTYLVVVALAWGNWDSAWGVDTLIIILIHQVATSLGIILIILDLGGRLGLTLSWSTLAWSSSLLGSALGLGWGSSIITTAVWNVSLVANPVWAGPHALHRLRDASRGGALLVLICDSWEKLACVLRKDVCDDWCVGVDRRKS